MAGKALAEKDKTISKTWAGFALKALEGMQTWLASNGKPPVIDRGKLPAHLGHVFDALQTHFHIGTVTAAASQSDLIDRIIQNYKAAVSVMDTSATKFTDVAVVACGAGNPACAVPGALLVKFTPEFEEWSAKTPDGWGPFCRAAMVLHECIHAVDVHATADAAIHVYEWDTSRYAAQTAAQAEHNPSSYASFAEQMNFGKDTRYGAAKQFQ